MNAWTYHKEKNMVEGIHTTDGKNPGSWDETIIRSHSEATVGPSVSVIVDGGEFSCRLSCVLSVNFLICIRMIACVGTLAGTTATPGTTTSRTSKICARLGARVGTGMSAEFSKSDQNIARTV
jgi:hypothetical protein